jgi:type II secretory pathway pseudopilin PulG
VRFEDAGCVAGVRHRLPLRCKEHKRRAFTLLELIAVMIVLILLGMLAIPEFKNYRDKATAVQCMANMRNITVGLRGYLQDHGNVWPQGPPPDAGAAWEDFWLGCLRPYGITEKTWLCPAIGAGKQPDAPRVHYTPTMFPPVPGIADRWATHPWLIERGPGHGHGALICYPDGSVKAFDKVLAELGVR